jgi:Tfp pilus assembly protein PilF
VELAGLLADKDMNRARKLLRECLTINPKYKPGIMALADTYRISNPEIAEKYYRQAESIN